MIYQSREHLKIHKINQRLKIWALVPAAVSLCPDAAHMYW